MHYSVRTTDQIGTKEQLLPLYPLPLPDPYYVAVCQVNGDLHEDVLEMTSRSQTFEGSGTSKRRTLGKFSELARWLYSRYLESQSIHLWPKTSWPFKRIVDACSIFKKEIRFPSSPFVHPSPYLPLWSSDKLLWPFHRRDPNGHVQPRLSF